MPVFKIQKGAGAAALGDSMKSALEITNQLEQQKVRNDQAQQRIDLAKQGAADAVFDRSERIRMQEKSYEFDSTQAKQKELMRQDSEDEARANYDSEVVDFYGIDSPEAKAYQELDPTEPAYHQERREVGQKIEAKKRETQLRGVRSKIGQMFLDDPSDPVIKNLKLQLDENAPIEDLVEEGNARYETWSADNAARVTGEELVADWRLGIPNAELGELKPEIVSKVNLYESISAGDPNSPMLPELKEEIMSEVSFSHMRAGKRKLQDEKDRMIEQKAFRAEFEEQRPEIRGSLIAPGTQPVHPNQIDYLTPEEKAGAMHVAFQYMEKWELMESAENPNQTGAELMQESIIEASRLGLAFRDFADYDAWLEGGGVSPPDPEPEAPEKPIPEGELDPRRKANRIWPHSAEDFIDGEDTPGSYFARKTGKVWDKVKHSYMVYARDAESFKAEQAGAAEAKAKGPTQDAAVPPPQVDTGSDPESLEQTVSTMLPELRALADKLDKRSKGTSGKRSRDGKGMGGKGGAGMRAKALALEEARDSGDWETVAKLVEELKAK